MKKVFEDYFTESKIVRKQVAKTKVEKEAMDLFGTMRDATIEEQNTIDRYLDSISVDTGVNFFDL